MKIKGRFAPLTDELGDDERFIIQSTDLDKLLYVLVIYTCHMTRHKAPKDPNFYKKRYGMRSKTGQIADSLRRLADMYPRLSWGEKSLSLLNSVTYKNEICTEEEKEQEIKEEKEQENPNALNGFEEVWKAYPTKVERSKALRSYCVLAITKGTQERILKALKSYRAHLAANPWKQSQHLAKWLETWVDWENYVEPEKEKKYASNDDRIIAQIRGK